MSDNIDAAIARVDCEIDSPYAAAAGEPGDQDRFQSLVRTADLRAIFAHIADLRAEVERLKAIVNERYFERSLSPADLKAAEKHCDWPAFQHAWNAVMNARTARQPAP